MRCRLAAVLLAASLISALGVGPDNPRLFEEPDYRDAERLIKDGRYDEAIPLLFRLDRAFPDEPEVLNWLGFAYRKLKDYPTSKRFYDAALRIDPNFRPALEYQGMWFLETGDIASAKANLEKLRQLCAACEETKDLEEALAKAGNP